MALKMHSKGGPNNSTTEGNSRSLMKGHHMIWMADAPGDAACVGWLAYYSKPKGNFNYFDRRSGVRIPYNNLGCAYDLLGGADQVHARVHAGADIPDRPYSYTDSRAEAFVVMQAQAQQDSYWRSHYYYTVALLISFLIFGAPVPFSNVCCLVREVYPGDILLRFFSCWARSKRYATLPKPPAFWRRQGALAGPDAAYSDDVGPAGLCLYCEQCRQGVTCDLWGFSNRRRRYSG